MSHAAPILFTLPRRVWIEPPLAVIAIPSLLAWNRFRPQTFRPVGNAERVDADVEIVADVRTWVEGIGAAHSIVHWRVGQPARDMEHELCHVLGRYDHMPPGWDMTGYAPETLIYDPADPDRERGIFCSLDVEAWYGPADQAWIARDFPFANRVTLPEVAT